MPPCRNRSHLVSDVDGGPTQVRGSYQRPAANVKHCCGNSTGRRRPDSHAAADCRLDRVRRCHRGPRGLARPGRDHCLILRYRTIRSTLWRFRDGRCPASVLGPVIVPHAVQKPAHQVPFGLGQVRIPDVEHRAARAARRCRCGPRARRCRRTPMPCRTAIRGCRCPPGTCSSAAGSAAGARSGGHWYPRCGAGWSVRASSAEKSTLGEKFGVRASGSDSTIAVVRGQRSQCASTRSPCCQRK